MSKDQHLFSGKVLGGDPSKHPASEAFPPQHPSAPPAPSQVGTKDTAGLLPGQSRHDKPVLGNTTPWQSFSLNSDHVFPGATRKLEIE